MAMKEFTLTIENTLGKSVELAVTGDMLIKDLKLLIQDKEGHPADEQILLLHGCTPILRDELSISSYGINDSKCWIQLTRRLSPDSMSSAASDRDHALIRLGRSRIPLIHIKDPSDSIHVFVVTHNAVQDYNIGSPYIVNSLMGVIQTKQGIPLDRQKLSYEGVELKEFSTLEDYGITNGAKIVLELKPTKFKEFQKKTLGFANKLTSLGVLKVDTTIQPEPKESLFEETPPKSTAVDTEVSAIPIRIESTDESPVVDPDDTELEMPGAWVDT